MEQEFVTLAYLGSLAGCVAVVTILTQLLKSYAPKIGAKYYALIGSVIVVVLRQVFVLDDLTAAGWAEAFVNLLICIAASSGANSYIIKPAQATLAANKAAKDVVTALAEKCTVEE